jgi:hypothetical protein
MPAFKPSDQVLFNPRAELDDFDFFTLVTPLELQEGEVWEVMSTLPPMDGRPQYCIRSKQDGRQRLAIDYQLRPAL